MRVNEIFLSVQGEGPSAGSPAIFVRLHGCPVACSWCDTPYSWDGSEDGTRIEVDELVHDIITKHAPMDPSQPTLIVITGGEPLIHKDLRKLIERLLGCGYPVEVETAGILPRPLSTDSVGWIVSPKLGSANAALPINETAVSTFNPNCGIRSILKFVISDRDDLEEAIGLVHRLEWPEESVWVMPCARTREEHEDGIKMLFDWVRDRRMDWRISPRLQVLAYGDRRGV